MTPLCVHVKTIVLAITSLMLLTASSLGQRIPTGLRLPKHGGIYVVAHRGAHDGVPENTLAAIQRAIDLDCDFVEVDVRTTSDGQLVNIHDASVDRYVLDGKKGLVSKMSLKELQSLDIGSRINSRWKDEKIPTMEQVLSLCKGRIGVYLDVKSAPIESLLGLVKSSGMELDTLWYIPANKVAELREKSDTCWPMPDPGPELFLADLLKATRPKIVASTAKYFSESFAKSCHSAGAIVIVDEAGKESWNKLLSSGADGIQSDEPAELIAFLKAR